MVVADVKLLALTAPMLWLVVIVSHQKGEINQALGKALPWQNSQTPESLLRGRRQLGWQRLPFLHCCTTTAPPDFSKHPVFYLLVKVYLLDTIWIYLRYLSHPVLKIDSGPPTVNLWSDWSPQKHVNRDKWNQQQKRIFHAKDACFVAK